MRSIALLATCLVLTTGCFTTVEPGHVGVQIRLSEVQEEVLEEGFNWHSPLVSVEEMTIQTQNLTMTGQEALVAMSSDQLGMSIDLTVLYHLNSEHAPSIRRYMPNYQDSVVLPSIRVAARDAVRNFKAIDAVSTHRQEVGLQLANFVRERVGTVLKQRNIPEDAVLIDDVQLRNISLPQELRESISRVQMQRQAANEREQAIETSRQEALRQSIEAEGRAKVLTIRANNNAEVRLIGARAEAEANETIAKSLTPQVLEARRIAAQKAVLSSDQTRTIFVPQSGKVPSVLMNMR